MVDVALRITKTPVELAVNRQVVSLGVSNARGAQGIQGPAGASGVTITRTSDVALGGQRVVISTPTGANYPDLSDVDHADLVLGLTTGASLLGADSIIQVGGTMQEGSWSWTLGPVYVGNSGVPTQTPPASAWLRQIGIAVAPDELLIDLRPPFFTL